MIGRFDLNHPRMVRPTHTMQAIARPVVIMFCLSVFSGDNQMPPVLFPAGAGGFPVLQDQFLFVMSLTATIRIPTIAMSITAPRIAA